LERYPHVGMERPSQNPSGEVDDVAVSIARALPESAQVSQTVRPLFSWRQALI
jgi:hypothetical protein